mmetsp:Transcript_10492/g.11508  ORF Transcript_10492/g.11508 Transcript_10492/m.11508 type:complete len:99 (+) Transcript_10492:97-393(+)
MTDSEYSFSLTTFAPSGKLLQIEYALNRVAEGRPALGIKAKNGVVLATEKKVTSPLVDEKTLSKVENPSFRVRIAVWMASSSSMSSLYLFSRKDFAFT